MRISIPTIHIPGNLHEVIKPASQLRSLLLHRHPIKACLVYFSFGVYSLLCLGVFFALVQPWINGDTLTRVGADSDRYWFVARLLSDPGHSYGVNLVSFNGNLLGPVVVALVLKFQFLVVVFNYLVLFLALKVASHIEGVRTYMLLALLMFNAETAVSLITLNKEIFALISAVLVAKYLLSTEHRAVYLTLALITSLVTRWEQAMLVLLVVFLLRKNSFFARRHKLALACVVAGITIAYSLVVSFKGHYLLSFTQYEEGANTIVKLNHLQASYGFPLVVLPKIAMTLLGELIRPTYYLGAFWDVGFEDLHSQFVLPLFSLALVSLLLAAKRQGKLSLDRPIAFLIVIYLVGTALTPFIQPRYEYFVYVLLCIELARDPSRTPGKPAYFENVYEPHRLGVLSPDGKVT